MWIEFLIVSLGINWWWPFEVFLHLWPPFHIRLSGVAAFSLHARRVQVSLSLVFSFPHPESDHFNYLPHFLQWNNLMELKERREFIASLTFSFCSSEFAKLFHFFCLVVFFLIGNRIRQAKGRSLTRFKRKFYLFIYLFLSLRLK